MQQSADNALDQEWQLVPVGDGSLKVLGAWPNVAYRAEVVQSRSAAMPRS